MTDTSNSTYARVHSPDGGWNPPADLINEIISKIEPDYFHDLHDPVPPPYSLRGKFCNILDGDKKRQYPEHLSVDDVISNGGIFPPILNDMNFRYLAIYKYQDAADDEYEALLRPEFLFCPRNP